MQPATSTATVIPPWVPSELHASYREIAAERGEEDAAAWARQAKRGKALEWTDEQVAHLRQRWEGGATALTIAIEIGFGATRSSVLGKIHRLGLSGRGPGAAAGRPRKGCEKPKIAVSPARPVRSSAVAKVAPIAPAIMRMPRRPMACEPVPAGGIEICDLQQHHCRFPLNEVARGDGEHLRYCGAARVVRQVDGMLRPYCAEHARLAYEPRPRSERQRDADEKRRQHALQRAREMGRQRDPQRGCAQ